MKTVHSILFVSALFATFMAVGMENVPTERQATHPKDCVFVQDSESLRLMLLYHNPVRGPAPAPCGHTQPRPVTVAG
ncbi:MAG: hypothetical protein K8F32_03990 [Rhodocyclaceae bacterium]|nr:hypothetical protein [Rhodocyclaceae bacterium]